MDRLALLAGAQEAHSALIHVPLVLLLIAPALLIFASRANANRRRLLIATLIVMAVGTTLLYLAQATGEITSEAHQLTAPLRAGVAEHRTLAAETAAVFTVATGLMGLILLLTLRFRLRPFELDTVLPVAFVVLYSLGVLLLVRTFQRGGDLVHELGI